MKKLTVAAAAFAAGMMSFAANGQEVKLDSPKAKSEAVEKTAAKREKKACPYLFGCETAAGKKDEVRTTTQKLTTSETRSSMVATAPANAARAAKAAAAKVSKPQEQRKASVGRSKQTAAKASRPKLVAKARKTTKGDTIEAISSRAPSGSYGKIIARYASAYGVPASLAHAVVRIESNFRPNARGRAGEIGLMQIKLGTARMMGYSGSAKGLYDPETNIRFGMKYLAMAHKLGGGSTCGTILKYNAGHGAKRMNPVSAAYCSKVKRHLTPA